MESLWKLFGGLFPSKRRTAAGHDDMPTFSSSTMPNGKSTAGKFNPEEKVDTAAACEVIYNTMKALKLDIQVTTFDIDPLLQADSDAYWDSLRDLDEATKTKFLKIAKSGAFFVGNLMYPFLPRENRVAMGIYTTYLVWIDDHSPPEDLKVFRKYCTSDRSKLSTPMRYFAEFLDYVTSFYGPHAGDMIWSATSQFLNVCIVEAIHGKGFAVPRSAILFPDYQRIKGGNGEPFVWAMFVQADLPEDEWLIRELFVAPDLIEYLDCGNDLMSFYKEHVIGNEECTYIWNYSSCHDISLLDGLKDTASRTLTSVERLRKIAAGQPELLARIEDFVLGYLRWQWRFNKRYHLQDMCNLHIAPRSK